MYTGQFRQTIDLLTISGSTVTTYDAATGEWAVIAAFGTPPQELPILLDTGSWDW
jgi:aspergillopepsin I